MSECVFAVQVSSIPLKQLFALLKTQSSQINLCVNASGLYFWCHDKKDYAGEGILIEASRMDYFFIDPKETPKIYSFAAGDIHNPFKSSKNKEPIGIFHLKGEDRLSIIPSYNSGISYVALSPSPPQRVELISTEEMEDSCIPFNTIELVCNATNCTNQKCNTMEIMAFPNRLVVIGKNSDEQIRHSGQILSTNFKPEDGTKCLAACKIPQTIFKQFSKLNGISPYQVAGLFYKDRGLIMKFGFGSKDKYFGTYMIYMPNTQVDSSEAD